MTAIIPFDGSAQLPAYLKNRQPTGINRDVATGAAFTVLSIKGKVWALNRNGERKVITRPDDPDEVAQSVQVVPVRVNMKARTYYAKSYTEGDSDNARPDCFSFDSERPDPQSPHPQANKCSICPHAQWGSKAGETGKGTACAQSARMALIDPENPEEPMLLRIPPASRAGFRDVVKMVENRKLDYNQVVLKLSFDKDAPSPKIVFKPVGLIPDALYEKVSALYEDETVRDIVGTASEGTAKPAEPVDADELDAAIAAKKVTETAKQAAKPAEPAKPAKSAKAEKPAEPEKPAKAAKVESSDGDDLLGDLDRLLSATDD